MSICFSRGYRSGNHRMYGWIVTLSKRQFFVGIKIRSET